MEYLVQPLVEHYNVKTKRKYSNLPNFSPLPRFKLNKWCQEEDLARSKKMMESKREQKLRCVTFH